MKIHQIFFAFVFILFLSSNAVSTTFAPPEYSIYSVEDLKAIEYKPEGSAFTLMNDIEITDEIWKPIGSTNRPFQGYFNGNNHTITFTKDTTLRPSIGTKGGGLFGNVYTSQIYDLEIVLQGNLTSESDSTGPLVGFVSGDRIEGIASSLIENCTVRSQNHTISGKNNVGGLVGYIENGAVINSSSDCSVKTEENNSGGLVGHVFNSSILDSSSSGKIEAGKYNAGGLIGCSEFGNISNVSATGSVKSEKYSGGLIGYVANTTVISDSSADGAVKPKGAFGNFIGGWAENYKPTATNSFYQKTEVDLEPVPLDTNKISKTMLIAVIGVFLLAAVFAVIYFKNKNFKK
jgi:The GLUG motif.